MKLLSLIGRCGGKTVKRTLKEEQYKSYDFNYLKRWIVKNFRNEILAAEGKAIGDKEIEIYFSFIDEDGNDSKIYSLSEKIIKYYSKCEGRICWSYKLTKYEVPKLISGYDDFFLRENTFDSRIQSNTDDLSDLSENKFGDNLNKGYEINWNSNSSSNKYSKMRSYNKDRVENKRAVRSTYLRDNKSVTNNSLSKIGPITKEKSKKSPEFKSSTAIKEPVYISPPIYHAPTISTTYRPTGRRDRMKQAVEGLGQIISASFQLLWMLIVVAVGIGIFIVSIYIFIKNMIRIWL